MPVYRCDVIYTLSVRAAAIAVHPTKSEFALLVSAAAGACICHHLLIILYTTHLVCDREKTHTKYVSYVLEYALTLASYLFVLSRTIAQIPPPRPTPQLTC